GPVTIVTMSKIGGISGGVLFAVLVVLGQSAPVQAKATSTTNVTVVNGDGEAVPVRIAETTGTAFDQVVTMQPFQTAFLSPPVDGTIDVSAYRQIRVSVNTLQGGTCKLTAVRLWQTLQDGSQLPVADLPVTDTCWATGTVDLPGVALQIAVS